MKVGKESSEELRVLDMPFRLIMKVGKESTPLLDRMKAGSNLILMINIGR